MRARDRRVVWGALASLSVGMVLCVVMGLMGPGAAARSATAAYPPTAASRVSVGTGSAVPAMSGAAAATSAVSRASKDVVGVFRAARQRQFIDCRGKGGPTVVLVAGLTGWSKDWRDQVGPWRRSARVCTYDRPGLGASKARRGSKKVNAGLHAKELRALLRKAGERGPYLLVGHSYGGMIVRAFNKKYRRSVIGMLLVDAVPAGMEADFSGYSKYWNEGGARISLAASSRATGFDRPLSGLPLVVLSAGVPITWAPQAAPIWNRGQDRPARASGVSIRLTARGSTHQLQQTAPVALNRSFRVLLRGVRRGNFRPGCHRDWSAVGADCADLNR